MEKSNKKEETRLVSKALSFLGLEQNLSLLESQAIFHDFVNIGFKLEAFEAHYGPKQFESLVQKMKSDSSKLALFNELGQKKFLKKGEKVNYKVVNDSILLVGIIQYLVNQENQKQIKKHN